MKIFDLSVEIKNGMVVWPGNTGVAISIVKTLEKDGVRLSDLHFGSHTGTHIDAPKHFVEGGVGIDKIDINKLIGQVTVREVVSQNNLITVENLLKIDFSKIKKIILKTKNSKRKLMLSDKFSNNYVSLSEQGAKLLAESGIDFLGVDYLSVEKKGSPGHPVHKRLLEAGIVIAEGLNLTQVTADIYQLYCGPIKVKDSDGAPARIFLIKS